MVIGTKNGKRWKLESSKISPRGWFNKSKTKRAEEGILLSSRAEEDAALIYHSKRMLANSIQEGLRDASKILNLSSKYSSDVISQAMAEAKEELLDWELARQVGTLEENQEELDEFLRIEADRLAREEDLNRSLEEQIDILSRNQEKLTTARQELSDMYAPRHSKEMHNKFGKNDNPWAGLGYGAWSFTEDINSRYQKLIELISDNPGVYQEWYRTGLAIQKYDKTHPHLTEYEKISGRSKIADKLFRDHDI